MKNADIFNLIEGILLYVGVVMFFTNCAMLNPVLNTKYLVHVLLQYTLVL